MEQSFKDLMLNFQSTISWWEYYCDFRKIEENAFTIKIQLSLLNSLLWEKDIETKFLKLISEYPETREVLPILLAVRDKFTLVRNQKYQKEELVSDLFNSKITLNDKDKKSLLIFFQNSWLKDIFQDKKISSLNDYVFWIETGLDSNARKNRGWKQMESLVQSYIQPFCEEKWYQRKDQATAKYILQHWNIIIESDKADRRFDFAVYNWKDVYLFETNFYSSGWSKLKSVAWEFMELYHFLQQQNKQLYRITDGAWWRTSSKPLEEAFNAMEWNIFNIKNLREGILWKLIK